MDDFSFEMSSELLGRGQKEVWSRVASWEGVNYELGPLIRMSGSSRFTGIAEIPADGESHLTSYLMLGGVLPFDAHRLAFREIVVPSHFDECSSNFMLRRWSHYRRVEPFEGGVRVRDRCSLVPRVAATGTLLIGVYAAIFRRRHRRLRAWYR